MTWGPGWLHRSTLPWVPPASGGLSNASVPLTSAHVRAISDYHCSFPMATTLRDNCQQCEACPRAMTRALGAHTCACQHQRWLTSSPGGGCSASANHSPGVVTASCCLQPIGNPGTKGPPGLDCPQWDSNPRPLGSHPDTLISHPPQYCAKLDPLHRKDQPPVDHSLLG